MAWKMFAIIFAFVLAYVTAEIPSYIHVCGRKDPNFDKCITNSIDDLKDEICQGIPELHSPPIEPFIIDNLVIFDEDNIKLYVKDAKITGLCDFTINSFHMDLDNLHFDTNILFKRILVNGTYDIDIRILMPFVHKGPVYLTLDNVEAKLGADMKIVNRGDKRYVYISKLNLKLDVKTLNSQFDTNEEESMQLNEILSTVLGSDTEQMISRVKPIVEKEVSKQVLSIANNIVKHFTYDELFPDRT